jgi:tRNA(Arg) A34 adenosine deaminase TadA
MPTTPTTPTAGADISAARDDDRWMRLAIDTAREGIARGQGPFGACIVRGGRVLAVAHNVTARDTDPTAHAEVTAVRLACAAAGALALPDCTMYASCEPCPMCFAACHWAAVPVIVYGAGIADSVACGFRELIIPAADMARLGQSPIRLRGGVLRDEAVALFGLWQRTMAGSLPEPRRGDGM